MAGGGGVTPCARAETPGQVLLPQWMKGRDDKWPGIRPSPRPCAGPRRESSPAWVVTQPLPLQSRVRAQPKGATRKRKPERQWPGASPVAWMPTGKGWLESHLGMASGCGSIPKNGCNPGSPWALGQAPQPLELPCPVSPGATITPVEDCQHGEG